MNRFSFLFRPLGAALLFSVFSGLASAQAAAPLPRFDGERALTYTKEFVASGPRWVGSPGHAKAQAFLERQFAKDDLVKDSFTASTPIGPLAMTNYIVKFPGSKDGIIVLASHYDTNYPLKDTGYVGANDGGSSTGLLLQLANSFRGKSWMDTAFGWFSLMEKKRSKAGQTPTRLMAAGISQPSGRPMGR